MESIVLVSALWCALADDSYFPIKTKACDEGVRALESEWYGNCLERMKEPRLRESSKDVNAEIYPTTILPTWGNGIAVRVERHGKFYTLSARRLDGQAGFGGGKLIEANDFELDADDSRTLALLIQKLNFFQMSTSDNVIGFDGDEWIVEGISQGKYHFAVRWCAATHNPEKRKLTAFVAFCKFLVDRSALSERPDTGGKLI